MNNYKMGWKFNAINKPKKNLSLNMDSIDHMDPDIINIEELDMKELIKYDIYDKYKDFFPEITNQGYIGACVPTCISTVYYYLTMKQSNYINFRISRLYLYYQVRKLYDDLDNDNGSTIIDCINILHTDGILPEFLYPYINDNLYKNPNKFLEKYSKFCKCLGFENVKRNQIKNKILLDFPILCGIKIFKNIDDKKVKKTGIIEIPNNINDSDNLLGDNLLGGHCIILIGFDDNTKYYKFINSWGSNWGDNGFGYLPYEYITSEYLSDEFYILKQVTNPILNLEQEDSIIGKISKTFKNIFN
jgi:hypothetical protein